MRTHRLDCGGKPLLDTSHRRAKRLTALGDFDKSGAISYIQALMGYGIRMTPVATLSRLFPRRRSGNATVLFLVRSANDKLCLRTGKRDKLLGYPSCQTTTSES
jgi:hypothetical protein